jgi:hypothetical protein
MMACDCDFKPPELRFPGAVKSFFWCFVANADS